jgi:hypothetical protein
MLNNISRLGIEFNPFEPAASGAPVSNLWIPEKWKAKLDDFFGTMQHTSGPKAYAILGEYGSGKTYLLKYLEREYLPTYRIRPYFFDNPGVQFYDLANNLLRNLGREEFTKSLWELLTPDLPSFQIPLWDVSFLSQLRSIHKSRQADKAVEGLARGIINKGITSDAEIAYKLGRMVVDTSDRPYFEYKDFVAGRSGSLVAEGEEAPYFAAIIRTLKFIGNVGAIAFLLDEFEEISLQKRLTQKQAQDYLATLKRLVNLTERENLWLILSMTPQAEEVTSRLQPALWERFISQGARSFTIPPLEDDEVNNLIRFRLTPARNQGTDFNDYFPFPDQPAKYFREDIKSSPRRLVKVCSMVIAKGIQDSSVALPFSEQYLRSMQEQLYPIPNRNQDNAS